MASKFQNRLLGTVVLVAVVVIVLPAILDGHKKHYQDDFAAIPLVAKPGDQKAPDALPPASQPLPERPPAGALKEVQAANAAGPSLETLRQATQPGASAPPVADSAARADKVPPEPAIPQAAPDEEPDAIMALLNQRAKNPPAAPQAITPQATSTHDSEPVAQAYVVQLGALKNADKVNDIVNKLRAAGYRAYTSPVTPVAGQITRILVGPEVNKDKLTRALPELHRLSGLSGVVKHYQVHE